MATVGGEEIDLTPTDGMAREAQKALDWRKEGFDGGTPVGLARARQLVNKQELSPSTVRRMHSFFSRHEVDKEGEGFKPGEPGFPSNGRVAWALWGGDPGQTWARAKSATLDRLEGKSLDYTKDMHYDDEDDDDRHDDDEIHYSAGPKDLKTGDFVKWNSSGGTAKGRIEHIMREGVLGVPDSSFSINATEKDPAALIRIYRDGAETETLVGHKFSTLTKITQEEALKSLGETGMKKVFKLDSVIKAIEEGEGELRIAGYASTDSIDRQSDRILPTAWTRGGLKNYENNPILLFNHDYNKPIGKVIEMSTDKRGLRIKGVISKSAGEIYDLVKEGVLSTFSVGFLVKDADYDKSADGLIIKDAELLEVSVVSVPANQDATFSLAKSFDNQEDYLNFKKQFINGDTNAVTEGAREASRKTKMDDNTQELINKAVTEALAASQKAAKAAEEKVAAEKAAGEALEKKVAEAAAKVISSSEERITAELEKRFSEKEIDLTKALDGLRGELAEKSQELQNVMNSKRVFSDRGDSKAEWKKTFSKDMDDAFLLARVTGKGYDTKFAKSLMEKVNTHSSVSVSSADFEQEVSTNIERDIQLELILAPMFREISMNTASMILPIMPDTGYAEITANAGTTDATAPNGTLDIRGANRGGIALTEIELRTVKMVAKSYLGNETEEDAILPVLPLLREAMIRQHARGVENMLLLGNLNVTGSAYPSLSGADGLLKYASTQSRDVNTGTAGTQPALTAAGLLTLRKNMGKYGLRASDVAYIVSQRAYFELLEDPEFQDFNLVNQMATKMTGEVGQVFGSPVMVCDEFPAPAAGGYYALAVNTRNFVVPRLRGVTVESDYLVEDQHRVLVTSQRLGFKEIIPNAKSVIGFKYPAAS
jgi:HK97 family phage prohead protease